MLEELHTSFKAGVQTESQFFWLKKKKNPSLAHIELAYEACGNYYYVSEY